MFQEGVRPEAEDWESEQALAVARLPVVAEAGLVDTADEAPSLASRGPAMALARSVVELELARAQHRSILCREGAAKACLLHGRASSVSDPDEGMWMTTSLRVPHHCGPVAQISRGLSRRMASSVQREGRLQCC